MSKKEGEKVKDFQTEIDDLKKRHNSLHEAIRGLQEEKKELIKRIEELEKEVVSLKGELDQQNAFWGP